MEDYNLKDVADAIYANREELEGTLMVLSSHLERIANALEEWNKIEIAKNEILKSTESMIFNDGTDKPGLYMTKNECTLGYLEALRYMLLNHGTPEALYPDIATKKAVPLPHLLEVLLLNFSFTCRLNTIIESDKLLIFFHKELKAHAVKVIVYFGIKIMPEKIISNI